jgi:hypothetical protein
LTVSTLTAEKRILVLTSRPVKTASILTYGEGLRVIVDDGDRTAPCCEPTRALLHSRDVPQGSPEKP